ncbi:hypothetical protein RHGRI_035054 [Rhododendron griersonianum]|uniref:Uncharacterized protein n=1 Tax=Rhododendron griersonianum TaxID=479676 RepID=A0AAV6I6H9_9ERIC|nr:hypothetical protein RHGRI_035054 [Rhododendron griersonianum]
MTMTIEATQLLTTKTTDEQRSLSLDRSKVTKTTDELTNRSTKIVEEEERRSPNPLERRSPNREASELPTKENILRAFSWLMEGCQPGHSLVFFYSGRSLGSLCPVDEINAAIVKPLPHGAKLHAIIDTCRSGTFLGLPFMYKLAPTSDDVTGALTRSFIEAVKNERDLTYGRLLDSIRTKFRETQNRLKGSESSNTPSILQVPQLTSSDQRLDMDSKPSF